MDARELKERAIAAYSRGRFARAAQLYGQLCGLEPRNGQVRLRLGDALVKAGEKGQAIEAYLGAAEMFAKEGLLPRAIAASKLVLELDPSQTAVQRMLAELYAQRRAASGPRRAVARPVAAAAPSQPTATLVEASSGGSAGSGREGTPQRSTPMAGQPSAPVAAAVSQSRIFLPGKDAGPAPLPPAPLAEAPAGLQPRRDVQAGLIAFSRFSELEMDFDVLVRMAPMAVPLSAIQTTPPGPAQRAPLATAGMGGPHAQPEELPVGTSQRAAPETTPGATDDLDFSEVTAVAEAPLPAPARKRASFTELELDDTSLLNTIAAVAEAVADEGGFGAEEETVFSLTDSLEEEGTLTPGTLPHIPLFSDLPTDAFIELFERCPLRRVREGQRVFQQGSYGDAFYVICEGAVRIVRESEGEERELAVLESGAFFGEVALLSDAPRTASVDGASDETQLLEISAPVLTELSHRYPSVAKALKKFCRERLLRTLVSTSALFRSFGKASRRKLLERFRARDVPRGHVFVTEGAESDGLYAILSGEVSVVREGQVLAHLREGELFGEMSLLQKTPATATVTATRRTSILRLPRADFDALILTHPQALMHLAELSQARRKHTEALFGEASGGDEPMVLI